MRFEMYSTRHNKTRVMQWRWRLRGDNGEIIAQGESYKRKKDCREAIELVQDTNAGTPTVIG